MHIVSPQVVLVAVSTAVIILLLYLVTEDSTTIASSKVPVASLFIVEPLESRGTDSAADEGPSSPDVELRPEVAKLVSAIKEATRVAAGGKEPSFSDDERDAWHAENPCRSRRELLPKYARRKHVQDVARNRQWDVVLREYSKLHRTCLRTSGNLTHYFMTKSTSNGCKFLIADVMGGSGLGNKILVVLSNILYAILTQRVVLVPTDTLLPFVFCEPFEGSSWRVDNDSIPFPPLSHPSHWQPPQEFYDEFDRSMRDSAGQAATGSRPYASAVTSLGLRKPWILDDQWHPRDRFFCNQEQERYRDIPWLYMTGCLYTLPNLFAVGSFRPTLEALFPDRMALTHLLRTVMLPGDTVWDRSIRIDDAYLAHADRRVGIQVRYKDGTPHYRKMNELYNARITECARANGILPDVDVSVDERTDDSHVAQAARPKRSVVAVFIACLYTGLHDHLTRLYLRHPSAGGESVALVQVTHEDRQEFGVEVDRQALAEVMCLSFSDDLFVTPISTYGGVAQAYGALNPWFLEIRPNVDKPCTRGVSVDICYQGGLEKYVCPYDAKVNGQPISHVVPYLKRCIPEDYARGGVQLITNHSSVLPS
ncbi:xyloglucan fucosyltransferase [Marchantia polymorpha subsp. ruderalis]|uniref:Fucosyltransferase n=2 Tax=Marchantia polymorpha TaxID=3197 RepID=A0AAF6BX28_MARPO|nr:hypothetical protein MARPO_0076s0054 [Marchantia polymorpha]BBN16562.1 hypothetical protein Mp_7g07400 [Marchantia polymorpha subsp. ruderalis]|eukprot:PTQ34816.1 hypothetical protein MARPO_0076s0054 [Marchantia polymorpha]